MCGGRVPAFCLIFVSRPWVCTIVLLDDRAGVGGGGVRMVDHRSGMFRGRGVKLRKSDKRQTIVKLSVPDKCIFFCEDEALYTLNLTQVPFFRLNLT